MSGIADVARLAGVSKSTASRALTGSGYVSDATRDRVVGAARALGYVASTSAVSLATGRTRNIGVIMPYVNRWFFAEVLEGIQASLLARGLDLTLYDAKPGTEGRRRIFQDFLARKRFDGLIAVGLEPAHDEVQRMLEIDRPVVIVVGERGSTSTVAIDDDHAVRRATEHLISLGHREIAFLGGGGGTNWAEVDRRRLSGYRLAMSQAGLDDHAVHVRSDVSLPGGYAAAVDLLGDTRRPTAIVGVCDEVAIGAIIASRRLGIRVPTDLSVVGIDDHEYAEMFALTTLEQVPREQGAAAVDLLVEQLDHPGRPPVDIRLKARLVMRASTAPPDTHESTVAVDMRDHARRRFWDE
ncbi:LacI family DNA-binding transcriptional regulator [Microbacterium sp. ARD31]|uniref:LacI family DNA-binding transcriptional regulator n=1 Tax=Microbacterium sp. ARD31 TaxID=2962576 RepID=UPI0028828571|nr:LacI family DNA-binding transcriptional regulator [Microbacterium sp. ARD31]MDT0180433.1 LacI family DNA-binding transcriptional regulator [Microbacterium sp. ARD31]